MVSPEDWWYGSRVTQDQLNVMRGRFVYRTVKINKKISLSSPLTFTFPPSNLGNDLCKKHDIEPQIFTFRISLRNIQKNNLLGDMPHHSPSDLCSRATQHSSLSLSFPPNMSCATRNVKEAILVQEMGNGKETIPDEQQ